MDPLTSAQHPSSDTSNPLKAFSRKLQSVIGSDQQPSIRIRHNGISGTKTSNNTQHDEFDADTVDLLDVVDPEVSTLSTLTNVQNSLFVPRLGKLVNRRPTYSFTETPQQLNRVDRIKALLNNVTDRVQDRLGRFGAPSLGPRTVSISSQITEHHYAVLPHGVSLDGWTKEQKEELDDRVRHMLHSRRSKFKRSMRGFGKYVRRPLGLFVTVYATLITLFGAAWVLFLIGWISLGSKRDYVINVVDNVLVALFAVMGDGLAPFRAVDTYHMVYIAYYHRKTWKQREKLGLPELVDHNDLPDLRKEDVSNYQLDFESLIARRLPRSWAARIAPRVPRTLADRWTAHKNNGGPAQEFTVLTEKEQATLEHHERTFSKSHTFYKPHETATHYAFPVKLLIAIVLLLDLHSCLQITLGACTWGISYKTRPFALTTVILCCSITCNVMGGVLISVGDRRTRKKDVLERIMRQELTTEALEAMETEWMKAGEERGTLDPAIRRRRDETKDREETDALKREWKSVPLLPKKLLGKGDDHRQPSLPQEARRSSKPSNTSSEKSSSSSSRVASPDGKAGGNISPLPPLVESAAQAREAQDETSQKTTTRKQRLMNYVRRADNDKS